MIVNFFLQVADAMVELIVLVFVRPGSNAPAATAAIRILGWAEVILAVVLLCYSRQQ